MKNSTRNSYFLWVLFLFALAVRVLYLSGLQNNPLFDTFPQALDHFNFDQGATRFMQGDWLAGATNNSFSPLYKYFLGVLYLVSGRNFYFIYMVQFCMGAFASVLVYLITRDLFGKRAGLIAFLGFALYSTEIIYEGILLRAAFITFLGLLSFYLVSRLAESLNTRTLVLATLALSLFFQSRPNTFLCLPLVCLFLHRHVFLHAGPERRYWGMFAGVLMLSFIPLLVQCYIVHGKFVFFDASGPHTFIAGNLTRYSGVGFDYRVIEEYTKTNKLGYTSDIQYLVNHISGDVPGFLKLYLRKLYFFFNNFETPSNLSIYLYREISGLVPWVWNDFGLYSSLGLVGIVLAIKKNKSAFLLFSYIVSLTLANLIFLNEARYRLPVVPYYIIFGAYAFDFVLTRFKERRSGKAITVVLVAGVLFAAFLEPAGVRPVRADDLLTFAYSWKEKGFIEKSDAYLDRAQALYPADARVYFNKGQNGFARQEFPQAALNYEKAIALNAEMTSATNRLVDTLFLLSKKEMDRGDCGKAIIHLKKVLHHRPQSSGALLNLGVCHVQLGKEDAAKIFFEKALQADPDFDPAKANLEKLEKN